MIVPEQTPLICAPFSVIVQGAFWNGVPVGGGGGGGGLPDGVKLAPATSARLKTESE